MWRKIRDRMADNRSSKEELYGLLIQDIARGTVMIFESLPGESGTVFSHGFLSNWEKACQLLVALGLAQPLRFDKITNQFVPAAEDFKDPATFKLMLDIDDFAERFKSRPAPSVDELDAAISVWVEVAACHGRVSVTSKPFQIERIRTQSDGSVASDFLNELGIITTNKFVDEAKHVMDNLVAAGYATKSNDFYSWTGKVRPAMQMLLR